MFDDTGDGFCPRHFPWREVRMVEVELLKGSWDFEARSLELWIMRKGDDDDDDDDDGEDDDDDMIWYEI